MPKIAIIGTTTWGVTLGVVLARKGLQVRVWARTEQEATELMQGKYDPNLPSDLVLPPQLSVTSSLVRRASAVPGPSGAASVIVFVGEGCNGAGRFGVFPTTGAPVMRIRTPRMVIVLKYRMVPPHVEVPETPSSW